jgi:hypothetical protein
VAPKEESRRSSPSGAPIAKGLQDLAIVEDAVAALLRRHRADGCTAEARAARVRSAIATD